MSRKANTDYCVVKNCNTLAKDNKNLSFHNFPKPQKRMIKRENVFGKVEEINQLKAWKMALKIGTVLPRMRVCSLHFEKDDYILPDAPGKRILKKTAVPSLNLPYKKKTSGNVKSRQERILKRSLKIENLVQKNIKAKKSKETKNQDGNAVGKEKMSLNEGINHENIIEEETCMQIEDVYSVNQADINATTSSPAEKSIAQTITASCSQDASVEVNTALSSQDASVQTSAALFLHDVSVQASEAPLLQEVSVQATIPFKYINLIKNNSELSSVTGIENFDLLNTIVDIVNAVTENKYKDMKMNTTDRIVMTYMKFKQNLTYSFLAVTFNCYSIKHCQRVFFDTVKVLNNALKVAISWPSKEEISKNLPKCFEGFENVRIVLDCTEIYIQQPKNLCCQLITYSQYKSSTTAKIMTGVTPAGNISYISKVYGGRVSDSTIFSQSADLLKLLETGDGIMVDRGFLIDELCEMNRWKCIRPPFLQDKKQFSNSESILTSKIAAARVHIERSNQRIKTFKIVGSKMPVGLLRILPEIITVICATINLGAPILSKEKFMNN